MKSKKNEHTLLIPGTTGWELWSITNGTSQLLQQTLQEQALEIGKIPHNIPLTMAFPVRELTALAIWTPPTDTDSVADLINLQIERMGLSQPEELGRLTQYTSLVTAEADRTLQSIDVLRPPAEGTLPAVSPQSFNVSPRCYPLPEHATVLWQEFGKWVVAITREQGQVVHFQGLTSPILSESLFQELRFTLTQLQLQQLIPAQPENLTIWTDEPSIKPEGYPSLSAEQQARIQLLQRPAPSLPAQGMLLPADTRAERLAAKQKQRQQLIGTIAAVLVIGLVAFAAYKLIDIERRAALAETEAQRLTQENQALLDHSTKWAELTAMVDERNAPLTLLQETAKLIPSNSLRFRRATYENQPSDDPEALPTTLSITIEGEAPESDVALQYDEKLQRHQSFQHLNWQNQAPTKSKNGWKFIYQAEQL